jgi:RES domain-containing protein
MIVYRIAHLSVSDLLSGSGKEGRWCAAGRKVIYCASSVALCCLESLLRRSGLGFSTDFQTVFYKIPDDVPLEEVMISSLRADWRLRSNYPYCQTIGHDWYDQPRSLVLKVPSALIPEEYNYVIKTTAPNIDQIKVIDHKIFLPDERLEQMLKTGKKTGR